MSAFTDRLLTEWFIERPNRQKRYDIMREALGTPNTGFGEMTSFDVEYDEFGNEIPANIRYSYGPHGGTGLLADIYDPKNQARFANAMMAAPGGEVLANAMINQIQSGGQAIDRLNWDANRQDNLVAQARSMLYNAPQSQPGTAIPPASPRVPMTPNAVAPAGTSPVPNTGVGAGNPPLRNAPIRPTGTAEDYPIYLAQRQKLNMMAMHPELTSAMEPMIQALDAEWGYGPGAPSATRAWRTAQRMNDYKGTLEDWTKMSRQTIMDKTQGGDAIPPANEVKNFVMPDGSHPQPGQMTYNQIYSAGGTYMTEAEQKETRDVKSALALTRNMRSHLEDIYKDWDPNNPLMSRALLLKRVAANKVTQEDVSLTKYERLKKGTLAKLIRAMGEKGALAEGDVERGLTLTASFFPIPDSKDVAFGLFDELEAILTKAEVNEKAIAEAERLGYTQRRFNAKGIMIFTNPKTGEEVVWEDK